MTQAAFLLFVFLKQFYIKSSGSVGIADLCMAFCVIFLVLDIVRGKRKMPSVTDLKREILNCISDLRSNYKSVFYY